MNSQHQLQISEPWDFEGPEGNACISVKGLGPVKGPDKPNWQDESYLVELHEPLKIEESLTRQLICSPRYTGDTIDQVVNGICVVGIARVKEDRSLVSGGTFNVEDVNYWAIGSIAKING